LSPTAILLITIVVLHYVNRYSESRVTQLVARHITDVSLAIDMAQTSFPSGRYLHNLIPEDGRLGLGLDESYIIHRILIADEEGRIIDSAEQSDISKNLKDLIGDLLPLQTAKPRSSVKAGHREPEQVLTYPVETDKGVRNVVIVISPHLLAEIVREESRRRWIAIAILCYLLILTVALASWRFTRPIRELRDATVRVSSGDFDFKVPVRRRDEMGALAQTFNEMLAGLRTKSELEEKLQRTERSALVGRFASGVAHEVRNPLSFINLSIDFMRDKFSPTAEASRAEYTKLCESMKEEIARLNRMVSDFLSLGRPPRLKLRELDARSLAEDVVSLVRAQAEQQGVRLTVVEAAGNNSQEYNTHFQGDAEQLKTCFSNLAINAVQAMPEGGALTITLHPQKHNVRIEVLDTGHGIAPDALEHIFEPYFSTKDTGTGLGLALTKKLIEDHGGQIMVTSEVGVGTTFVATLPREPAVRTQSVTVPQTVLGTS
jgi:signal transduction histidine kinase